jgi:hypothetical protein
MTVRAYLHKIKLKQFAIVMPQFFIFAVLIFHGKNLVGAAYAVTAIIVTLTVLLASVIVLYRKALCPRCGYNFYHLSVRRRKSHQVDYCPGCALELDNDYP